MAGRKPKPTALKLIDGNPGKRAINKNEPVVKTTLGEPPAEVVGEALVMWQYLVKTLPPGLLTGADLGELKIYCCAYALHAEAMREVQAQGAVVRSPVKGEPMQNPYLSIANRQAEIMMKTGSNLGLSPTSRAKLTIEKPDGKNDFQEFS